MSFSSSPIDTRFSRFPTATVQGRQNKIAVDWLLWLSTLLVDARSMFLLDLEPGQLYQWPTSTVQPDGAVQLGLRAHATGDVIRSKFTENSDEILLAIPLAQSKFDARSVLLVSCLNVSAERQKKLIHLARWASEYRPCLSRIMPDDQKNAGIFRTPESISDRYLDKMHNVDNSFSWLMLVNLVCKCTSVKRVVLASVFDEGARIIAISDQTDIDHRRELIQDLQQAMMVVHDEGIPSFSPVDSSKPKSSNASITPGLQILQDRSWLMLPISALGKQFVILLERSLSQKFSVIESEEIASQLNPAMVAALTHQEANLPLLSRFKAQLLSKRNLLADSKYRYVGKGLLLLALILLLFIPVEHRISASASIDADDSHVLVAPIDAILSSVHVSAGDVVTNGQLLATFDDRELKLQEQQWQAETQKNYQEYTMALATHDRVELSRLRADAVRIEAQLELVRQHQERIRIRAPIDGVVLSGHWDDSLGAALKSGEKLFEIGTPEDHRLVLSVPERSIDLVKPAQLIALRMAANPTEKISATVESVSPVAIATQGVNTIKVFARMNAGDSGFRPGMQGVAKILVGEQSRATQWMVGLRARLIVWAWKFGLIK